MNIKKIAELLPEGLSEGLINEIASLVESTIEDRVKQEKKKLETKVLGFLRAQIDSYKDQAQKELELESEVYRNAKLMESVKAMLSLEITEKDENIALEQVVKENSEFEKQVEILTEELTKQLEHTEKLEKALTILDNKYDSLVNEHTDLVKEHKDVLASPREVKNSSGKAIVISESEKQQKPSVTNPFLTDDVLRGAGLKK